MDTAPNYQQVASLQGTSMTNDCPDGSYLTADNTCMMTYQDFNQFDTYASVEPMGYDGSSYMSVPQPYMSDAMIAPVQKCPEGTYLAPDQTCLQYESDLHAGFQSASFETAPQTINVSTDSVTCPDGTYLTAQNECQMSAKLIPEMYLRGTMTGSFDGMTLNSTAGKCPEGTYKDPEGFCMKFAR